MSDERTLPATTRRRAEALARGETARSGLLTSSAALLAAVVAGASCGPELLEAAAVWLRAELTGPEVVADPEMLLSRMQSLLWTSLGWLAWSGAAAALVAIVLDVVQGRGVPQTSRIQPDADRLWRSGISHLAEGCRPLPFLGEILRWTGPCLLTVLLLFARRNRLAELLTADPPGLLALGSGIVAEVLLRTVVALTVIGGLHYAWRRWQWEASLRMTPDELRDELCRQGRPNPR